MASRGFTMLELVIVVLLLAVLSAVALPRLGGALAVRGPAWREQVQAALRQAHSVAQGHRRLVCVAIASQAVTLTIANANPASSCNSPLAGGDGDSRWAWDSNAPATTGTPATLYFQPDGRVTSDGAGTTVVNASISIGGEATVTLVGETGHVQ